MKLMSLFIFTIVALTTMAPKSYALDRCESAFRRGLIEMNELFKRMSDGCREEVNLGDDNREAIKRACSSSEIQLALSMQSIENSRLTPLCQDDSCTRLRERGVCVKGQPFTFYLEKFDL